MPALIPAASRAMAVFEVFAREQRALSNADMAKALSLAESSCSDLLHTLLTLGHLRRTSRTRRFYPTDRLLDIARRIGQADLLAQFAQETVDEVTRQTRESAFFGVLARSAVQVVAAQQSPLALRYVVDVGARVSLHASALGKALLGLLPRAEAARLLGGLALRSVTAETLTGVEQLMVQIDAGRAQGWYEARGEGAEGVTALAMAGWLGEQPAAISLAGPAERIAHDHAACLASLRGACAALFHHH
ncbi:IclR family transcriptional regulator [Pseudorhodoferax sp.]|uniref:IclR family transcriptional regulator n=1 Tax=Pseudorhodoferax sp. TaxID=1993553 RepID=UPI002DD647FD|nr:IclR family transcriptional regulator C-terminal domain-containing protein [Pseudorhodoferax sp.]